jgi:hypothetical protein
LFKSPNLQNFPSPSKPYPVKRQIPKNIWPSLEFKQQQPLSQISSVAAGTTFYRFGHKRLKNFLQTTDSEMQTLCWISRPYSPFLLFPPWLRRLRAMSPSLPRLVPRKSPSHHPLRPTPPPGQAAPDPGIRQPERASVTGSAPENGNWCGSFPLVDFSVKLVGRKFR